MFITTGNSSLFVNVTTCLIEAVDTKESIYSSKNWSLKPNMLTTLMTYIDHAKIDYVFLYCNQPTLSMKAIDPRKFSILLSEITHKITQELSLQVTQKTHPVVISFSSTPKSGWQFPNSQFFDYVKNLYNLDFERSTLIGDSTMDKQCVKNNKITNYYQSEVAIELNKQGKFSNRD